MPLIPRNVLYELYDEYPNLQEYLSEIGEDIYYEFNTTQLTRLFELFDSLGLKDVADMILQNAYWSEEY